MRPLGISVKVLRDALARSLTDRRGATAVEYGLIAGLVVITMIIAVIAVGNTTSGMWNNTQAKVTAVTPG